MSSSKNDTCSKKKKKNFVWSRSNYKETKGIRKVRKIKQTQKRNEDDLLSGSRLQWSVILINDNESRFGEIGKKKDWDVIWCPFYMQQRRRRQRSEWRESEDFKTKEMRKTVETMKFDVIPNDGFDVAC